MPNRKAKDRKMLKKKLNKWLNRYGRTKKQLENYKKKHGADSIPPMPRFQGIKMIKLKSLLTEKHKNEMIKLTKDIRTRKGVKIPKGKYEVVKAVGKFATLLSWDKRDTYHMVNIDVLQKYARGL